SEVMGDVRGSPAYQLVDDFAGTSLVCGWVWHRWADLSDWNRSGDAERLRQRMLNICVGWSEGSTAFDLHGPPQSRTSDAEVLPSTLGCTHLNDVLRALADVPGLAQDLPEARPSRALPQ